MKIHRKRIYRYRGRGVKIVERAKKAGAGFWVVRWVSDDEDDFIAHEDDLEETGIRLSPASAKAMGMIDQ